MRNRPFAAVAVSALVVLLVGGGAATAAKWIDGKRIKPGTVAAKQLKNRAVTTAKLQGGAVGTGQLKNGSVTAAKLAPGVGAAGPTGPAGPAVAYGQSAQPNYLVGPGGGTLVLEQTLALGPAGYVIGGYLKMVRQDPGAVTVSCTVNRVFRDGGGVQVGSSQEIGTPAGNVSGSGVTTIPLAGLADATSPPGGAVDLQVRVVCATDVPNAVVGESQLTAIAADQINP
jgi:hypothetical protein